MDEFVQSYRTMLQQHVEEEVIYLDISRSVNALVAFHSTNNAVRDEALQAIMKSLWPKLVMDKDIISTVDPAVSTPLPLDDLPNVEAPLSIPDSGSDSATCTLPVLNAIEPSNLQSYKSIPITDTTNRINLHSDKFQNAFACCCRTLFAIPDYHESTPQEFVNGLIENFAIVSKLRDSNFQFYPKTVSAAEFLEFMCYCLSLLPADSFLLGDIQRCEVFLTDNDLSAMPRPQNLLGYWKSQQQHLHQRIHQESSYPELSKNRTFDLSSRSKLFNKPPSDLPPHPHVGQRSSRASQPPPNRLPQIPNDGEDF